MVWHSSMGVILARQAFQTCCRLMGHAHTTCLSVRCLSVGCLSASKSQADLYLLQAQLRCQGLIMQEPHNQSQTSVFTELFTLFQRRWKQSPLSKRKWKRSTIIAISLGFVLVAYLLTADISGYITGEPEYAAASTTAVTDATQAETEAPLQTCLLYTSPSPRDS